VVRCSRSEAAEVEVWPWWRERTDMTGEEPEDREARGGWRAMNATKGKVVAPSFCEAVRCEIRL